MSPSYKTILVRQQGPVLFITLHRPEAGNSINVRMIDECSQALVSHAQHAAVVILEGLADVFCSGADFQSVRHTSADTDTLDVAEPLYTLWEQLAQGPFVSIAHVRGKANAGGVGFAAACDIVIAEETAVFSLSEMLFGLFPACVLPFLVRRIGYQRAHYLTLSTQGITGRQASEWGLVDVCGADSGLLLRRHIPRLTRISKEAVIHYKSYMSKLRNDIPAARQEAVQANRRMFADPGNLARISRFVETGQFPWEA
ncbi:MULTISPECIES: enoyl-CoA hydratase/isomerase [Paenibacillus]|uniref:enoyl-CoA hydratase/isomerase n=1 Tax=Paenibacillus TaxID=44249 RepID=UPI0022B86285|nr:enoyl-CoA hydratase/isomerase [Paenibacillus caseinilyticus]MCZ8522697.1 enoyl-CoA hydratase/isomerase [Paenibacillus caseinilyticus]